MRNLSHLTADELRRMARESRKRSTESFERCDTDGFLTQSANDTMAAVYDAQADLNEGDGRSAFPALFDLTGNLIAAKLVDGRYGASFMLLADESDPHGPGAGWFHPSESTRDPRTRDARKGYYVGYVAARAYADVAATGIGVVIRRADGGFSRDVIVLDDGCGKDVHRWYAIATGEDFEDFGR